MSWRRLWDVDAIPVESDERHEDAHGRDGCRHPEHDPKRVSQGVTRVSQRRIECSLAERRVEQVLFPHILQTLLGDQQSGVCEFGGRAGQVGSQIGSELRRQNRAQRGGAGSHAEHSGKLQTGCHNAENFVRHGVLDGSGVSGPAERESDTQESGQPRRPR